MEPDPIGLEGGSNPYAYAGSNPVMNVDPSGLVFQELSEKALRTSGMDMPSIPEPIYQALMGAANSVSFGIAQPFSDWANGYPTANMDSSAYKIGEYGSIVLGGGSVVRQTTTQVGKSIGKYSVGSYNWVKGTVSGLDAHHVGQKAIMKKFIPDYDPVTAPAILVPKLGHTIKGPNGIVSRSATGLSTPREVLARDILELRRVYPDIPNTQLQKLIRLNKSYYPQAFIK